MNEQQVRELVKKLRAGHECTVDFGDDCASHQAADIIEALAAPVDDAEYVAALEARARTDAMQDTLEASRLARLARIKYMTGLGE